MEFSQGNNIYNTNMESTFIRVQVLSICLLNETVSVLNYDTILHYIKRIQSILLHNIIILV